MKYIGTFTTESGNIYLYDGTSNMVLPINKEIASIVENTVELDRNKIREVANTNIKNIIDTRRMLEVTANTSGKILQIVSSVIDVKLLNLYKKHGKAIKSILNKYFLATIKQGKSLICYSQNTQFISTILQLILLLVSGFMIIDGKITIGTYTAFGGYATKIVGSIQAFSSIIVLVTPIQSSAIRIYEFLGLDEENDNKQLFLKNIRII